MLMYSQTMEVVSERIKRSLILSQFLEHCPRKWQSRIMEVSNLELNTSDQIKLILDTTRHELLTNNWSNIEENDQVAYMSRGRTNKKDQSKENTRYTNRGRSMSRSRKPIVCYNCFKKGHIKKECRSPAYCQDCRQEHKPGSADCKNAWKYGQLSRDHRKDKNGNYGYEPQVRRDNNYRYSSQQRSGNQYYNGNSNQV